MDNTSLYQSQLLSGMAQRFYNREFIAHRILTPATVPQLQFQYHVWDSGVVYRVQKTGYGQDGSVNMIDLTTGSVEMHGLKAYVDPMELNQAPEMAVRAAKVRALMNSLKLGMEKTMADSLFSSSVITNGATLSGTDQWSHEDSDPKVKIQAAQNGQPVLMNSLLVGKQVDDKLKIHPLILEAVKYTQGGVDVTNATIARYLGVDNYIVGDSFVDSAVEGQTASLGFIWGKKALLFHRAKGPSTPLMDEVSLGYLPMWGGGGNGGVRVYTGRNGERGTGEGVEWIKAEMTYKPLITSVACGYLFTDAVA
jgi:hypothetical protein